MRRDHHSYLTYLTHSGLERRFRNPSREYWDRVKRELGVIESAGFSSYFLIVWDIVQAAKRMKIPMGPGRGSVCGSMVAYATEIIEVDPIEHNIPFGRFLNLDRISMPDVDLDICQVRRQEVIDYVRGKYGDKSVASIVSFATDQARAIIIEVCRMLHVDEANYNGEYHGNRIGRLLADMVPEGAGADQVFLREYVYTEEGKALVAQMEMYDPIHPFDNTRRISILDHCLRLEGVRRHTSIHAAGIVIAPGDIEDVVPLYRKNKDAELQTMFSYQDVEALGLLKFDLLGLRTVTVLGDMEGMVQRSSPEFRIADIPMDDGATFGTLQSGNTTGVFQLEGEGMTRATVQIKPESFQDVVALLALYRPGPMEQVSSYAARKAKTEVVYYDHPDLAEVLSDTYGLIVYQEQVMGLAQKLAGYSDGEADVFRKAIGKKIPELIAEQLAQFKVRALERGYEESMLGKLSVQIDHFGRYGFNRGHATGYGFITYWTAWFRTHYPAEFFAANLNSYAGDIKKITKLIDAADRAGVKIRPPDINLSKATFDVVDGAVLYGLSAIRGLGDVMVKDIVEERDGPEKNEYRPVKVRVEKEDGTSRLMTQRKPVRVLHEGRSYDGPYDFCRRLTHITINAKKALAVAGAFGVDPGFRTRLYDRFEILNNRAKAGKAYDMEKDYEIPQTTTQVKLFDMEREILGYYVSGHPLSHFGWLLDLSGARWDRESFGDLPANVTIAGVVSGIRP